MQKFTRTAENSIVKVKYAYRQTIFPYYSCIYFEKCQRSAFFECIKPTNVKSTNNFVKKNDLYKKLSALFLYKCATFHEKNLS